MERWQGKVAVVTGASAGIGKAVALSFVQNGLKVAALARRRERLDQLVNETQGLRGELFPLPVDIRDEASLLQAFEKIKKKWNTIHILVNNAGIGRDAPLISGPSSDWREMFDTNVLALMVATKEAMQQLKQTQSEGHIFHIGSMSGHRVPPGNMGCYAATKYAVKALAMGLRNEIKTQNLPVRVTLISPGFVETEFEVARAGEEAAKEFYAKTTCLTSQDVANAVLYALAAPSHVDVNDIWMRPTPQKF
ncbi:Dehydrogenase/reductase SDR family member 11 [Galdieria sulphuraria]|uniref:Chloroplast 3-oxoacyl-[acyl-carrier protein] reductase orecursor n=1 Tax=Galdieria sulphuraria TaxID=130081 RepID=M2XWX2_GALSU|nr:chloroplast 3-oxoacyl-[acyl-carrier protein] reductase orecursor [Galdieria sulphuraria]EME27919.1 chloroplast 3-oxoacyl-[acyl-carrier protein] reductase orecursor [Galdieria sulphuraria]GJD07831.1 Dehydrogenase/reductase SDR family member 11 [Galdieria sulphuraria]|eukprot:XP_005704439.1 chloroplast 3-oxoacyl-[acyl-carrier protein] reductase orecursor [Galdieria sulphuraria]